jgi:hypothetical protein
MAGANRMHVVWNQTTLGGTVSLWGRFSSNGGEGWSAASQVSGMTGLSGPVGLAADSSGAAHAVAMGQGVRNEANLLYTRWDGQAWSRVETTGLANIATPGNAAVAVLVPAESRLVVLLREFVFDQSGRGRFDVRATDRQVAIGAAVAAPTYTPAPAKTPTPGATRQPTATPTPELIFSQAPPRGRDALSEQMPLLVAGALALLLVVGMTTVRAVLAGRR